MECFHIHYAFSCTHNKEYNTRPPIFLQEKEDKLMEIDSHKVAAAVGDQSDRVRLLQYVKCSLKPQQIQSGKAQSTSACANFLRKHMAESLRSRRGMYQTNLMFAGYDLPQSEVRSIESFHRWNHVHNMGMGRRSLPICQ